MSRRALLTFCPLEYEYQAAYGIMPDYDRDFLISKGMPPDEANRLVNGRLNALWQKMKYDHEHAEERVQRELEKECPF